jgi:Fe-S oxidoreductase
LQQLRGGLPTGDPLKELGCLCSLVRKPIRQDRHDPGEPRRERNVFDEDNAERGEWVEDMRKPPADSYVRPRAEVVYITGCVSAYFPLAQKIPIALAEIMDASGVDFTLLGEEEWCCGFPLLGAGLMEMFEEFRVQNLSAVKAKGSDRGLRLPVLLPDVGSTGAELELLSARSFFSGWCVQARPR